MRKTTLDKVEDNLKAITKYAEKGDMEKVVQTANVALGTIQQDKQGAKK